MRPSEITTIVLCHQAQPDVVGAVRSLLDQSTPTEILVVNSGGGSVRDRLQAEGIKVRCLDYRNRMFVGGARNRGIEHTTSRYVAFLASDCRALPGWVEHRLAVHEAGFLAVASAIVNRAPANRVASAAYLGRFMHRLPGLPADRALRFGASYDRSLFEEFGFFDERLRSGEDTEFLERLPPDLRPAWDGRIQTDHLNETKLLPLLRDQFRRGRRHGDEMRRIFGATKLRTAKNVWRERKLAPRLAALGLAGDDLAAAMRAMPIVKMMLVAKAAGVMLSDFLPSETGRKDAASLSGAVNDNH